MTPDDPFHADPLAAGRLAITGAVSDPRTRTLDTLARPRVPIVGIVAVLVLVLSAAAAVGLLYMAVWAIACLWRWSEPLLTVLAVGVALVVIVLGIGLPG